MSFKNLFINSDDSEDKKPTPPPITQAPKMMPQSIPTPTHMPTEMVTPVVTPPTFNSSALQEMVKSVGETYQNGFISLNREGYDFFEYYQSILSVSGSTSDSYKMAFTLGKSLNPNITPESLASDASYYISEIDKVYNQFQAAGQGKAFQQETEKAKAKVSLTNQIEAKKAEIASLQTQLESLTSQLGSVDSSFDSELQEINLKLQANQIARDNLVNSIQEVSNNIKNFLQ